MKNYFKFQNENSDDTTSPQNRLLRRWQIKKDLTITKRGAILLLTLIFIIIVIIIIVKNKTNCEDTNPETSSTTQKDDLTSTTSSLSSTTNQVTESTTGLPISSSTYSVSDDHLPLVRRSEWNATEYNYKRIKLDLPKYVIIGRVSSPHCFCKTYCTKYVQVFQKRDYKQTREDIRFNFLVGGDGNIYEGRGWNTAGNHTKGFNNNSLAIAFIGNFNLRVPTLRQVKAAKKLVDYSFENSKVAKNYKLLGQGQITNNLNTPGYNIQKIIKNWNHWVAKP